MIETLTVATPLALLSESLPLAVALGMASGDTPDEWAGAFSALRVDAAGNEWRVLSLSRDLTPVRVALGGDMPSPELQAARDKLLPWQPAPDPEQPWPPAPTADTHPNNIIAIIGVSGLAALDMVGLVSPADDTL